MSSPDFGKELVKARNSAFRLLKIRNRSEREIRDRLKQKKISEDIIEQTIGYLKNIQLIDDRKFTKDWIAARLTKPFGLRRIIFELKGKGIDNEIIKEELACARQGYDEEGTVGILVKQCKEKFKETEQSKRRKKIFGYLARRGFSLTTIEKATQNL